MGLTSANERIDEHGRKEQSCQGIARVPPIDRAASEFARRQVGLTGVLVWAGDRLVTWNGICPDRADCKHGQLRDEQVQLRPSRRRRLQSTPCISHRMFHPGLTCGEIWVRQTYLALSATRGDSSNLPVSEAVRLFNFAQLYQLLFCRITNHLAGHRAYKECEVSNTTSNRLAGSLMFHEWHIVHAANRWA
jgi:hypothetical protein